VKLSPQTVSQIDKLLQEAVRPREVLLVALELAQKDSNYIDEEIAVGLAERFGMSRAEMTDVLSFYTVLHREPVGRHVVRVCGTLPCAMAGAERIVEHLKQHLGVEVGGTTEDGLFTLQQVECLGLCEQAPAMLIDDRAYGNLTLARVEEIIASYRRRPQ
jgi:NADH-quinone oxidoreductase subunit E